MNVETYLEGVNKTWKNTDGLIELKHCRLALLEEVGEISGWYKKHIGYCRPKDEVIKNGLKGEFGDLLYYLVKTADISGNFTMIKAVLDNFEPVSNVAEIDYVGCMHDTASQVIDLMSFSIHTSEFAEALIRIAHNLMELIYFEGWTVEDIQLSNLAKLNARHGDKFKDDAGIEAGRNRETENKAIDGK